MSRPIVECVPNFSEGRDVSVIDAIVEAIEAAGAAVLDRTSDPDHNRSVVTFAGDPDEVAMAALNAVQIAVERIDLRKHHGVHPRIGAADVVPFVPVSGISLAECAEIASEVGRHIWEMLGVPVYLYEAAARRPACVNLADVRRDACIEARLSPDFGGPDLHPTAGATVVGARKFLVAFNVNLDTPDVAVAKRIARKVRFSSGGLPCVKALGLSLASHNLAQVSMNLTDFETTGIDRAFDAVRAEAEREGVKVVESELIGLVPRRALENVAANTLGIAGFHRGMVLENRLDDTLAAHSVDAFLDGLTGGGAAAAASAAMSAAIALAVPPHIREFQVRRRFFAAAVERDRHAWQAYQQAPPEDSELLLHEAARVPLEVAEEAAWLRGALQRLTAEAPHQYASDLVTAEALASAALAGATATVRANLALMQDAEMARAIEERLDRLS